jgi:hypothetical protein
LPSIPFHPCHHRCFVMVHRRYPFPCLIHFLCKLVNLFMNWYICDSQLYFFNC